MRNIFYKNFEELKKAVPLTDLQEFRINPVEEDHMYFLDQTYILMDTEEKVKIREYEEWEVRDDQ